jgi:LmbE family N-acetylglucosaminyl deacetylase
MRTYEDVFKTKTSVLFVTAHPDDADVFFGGLIAKLRSENKTVNVLLVTTGARGSRENEISEDELAKNRLAEQREALKNLGVDEDHLFTLGYKDGEVESNMTLIGQIAKYIRKFKPEIVCTHEPDYYYTTTADKTGYFVQHRDHRNIGVAVIDAVYPFSRDRSFFPEHALEGITPHSVYEILLDGDKHVNMEVDYTEFIDQKKKALASHKSQFSDAVIEHIISFDKDEDKYKEKFNYLNLMW